MVDGKLCSEEFDRSDADCKSKSVSNNPNNYKICYEDIGNPSPNCNPFLCNTKCVATYSASRGSSALCIKVGPASPIQNFVCHCTYNC